MDLPTELAVDNEEVLLEESLRGNQSSAKVSAFD